MQQESKEILVSHSQKKKMLRGTNKMSLQHTGAILEQKKRLRKKGIAEAQLYKFGIIKKNIRRLVIRDLPVLVLAILIGSFSQRDILSAIKNKQTTS